MADHESDPWGFERLSGRWVNMDPRPEWFHALDFSRRDDSLVLRPEPVHEPRDWGAEPVDLYRFKPGEPAFSASYEVKGMAAVLTAYANKGLIVLAGYVDYPEQQGRNVLCRDFFVPDRGEAISAPDRPAGTAADLLGCWENTETGSTGIGRCIIREDGDRYFLRVFGSFGETLKDWGEVEVRPTIADHDQTGFFARFRFDGMTYELAANCKLGVLVILCCACFDDGSGRPDYMARAFFRQAPDAGGRT